MVAIAIRRPDRADVVEMLKNFSIPDEWAGSYHFCLSTNEQNIRSNEIKRRLDRAGLTDKVVLSYQPASVCAPAAVPWVSVNRGEPLTGDQIYPVLKEIEGIAAAFDKRAGAVDEQIGQLVAVG